MLPVDPNKSDGPQKTVQIDEDKEQQISVDDKFAEKMPQESIIKRVANFKEVDTKQSKPSDESIFDPSALDKIESVEDAKKYAQNAYKSFEKGYQEKFQSLAELRKTLEGQIKNEPSSWTTEKVRNLMNDQTFLASANDVLQMSKPSDNNEYSALSDSEKREIAEIKRNNQMLIHQQQSLLLKQEDEQLKGKYPNYNPNAVDTITASLLANKIKNTREYIWKASDYDSAVNRAYQLGLQDAKEKLNENNQAASYGGTTSSVSSGPIQREKNESGESFLRRLYVHATRSVGAA